MSFESMSESFCGYFKCLLGIFSNCWLMYSICQKVWFGGWTGQGERHKFQVYIEFCIYLVLYSRFIYEQYKKLYGFWEHVAWVTLHTDYEFKRNTAVYFRRHGYVCLVLAGGGRRKERGSAIAISKFTFCSIYDFKSYCICQ